MQINFQKNTEGDFIILFEDQAICLEFAFQPTKNLEVDKIVQFKGLLHSRPINSISQSVVLDREGLLSLSYHGGDFWVKMEKESTRVVLPIGKEVYSRIDHLLNQLIE